MQIHEHVVERLDGTPVSMRDYLGSVLLVVNVASRCGYTPQYAGLEALHRKYKDRGFSVLGFPCNQFGGQEPGGPEEIATFCQRTYDVTFPMFAKVDVNGPQAHPLFTFLKASQPGVLGTEAIKWNFTKFLVNQAGEVVKRYGSSTAPDEIDADVAAAIAAAGR
jgi:glutathione peroxidase